MRYPGGPTTGAGVGGGIRGGAGSATGNAVAVPFDATFDTLAFDSIPLGGGTGWLLAAGPGGAFWADTAAGNGVSLADSWRPAGPSCRTAASLPADDGVTATRVTASLLSAVGA